MHTKSTPTTSKQHYTNNVYRFSHNFKEGNRFYSLHPFPATHQTIVANRHYYYLQTKLSQQTIPQLIQVLHSLGNSKLVSTIFLSIGLSTISTLLLIATLKNQIQQTREPNSIFQDLGRNAPCFPLILGANISQKSMLWL